MKKAIIFSATVLMLALSACSNSSTKSASAESTSSAQTFNSDTTKLKSGDTFYQCEMDPAVISDKPGTCPKCGMELETMIKK